MAGECKGKCDGKCGRCGIDTGIAKAFEDNGTPINLGTPECKKWLGERGNDCANCPHGLGCRKYATYIQMQEYFRSIVQRLIKIKTPEEMKEFEDEFGEK